MTAKIWAMIDVGKQIEFWRAGSEEDFAVARELIDRGRVRHGLFFLHLSLEKALKAHVCRVTRDIAPRLHNLVRLAELGKLHPPQENMDALAEINAFNLEGRYPESLSPPPTSAEAHDYLVRAEGVLRWLNSQS
jgi:HEPN domain-containing protein